MTTHTHYMLCCQDGWEYQGVNKYTYENNVILIEMRNFNIQLSQLIGSGRKTISFMKDTVTPLI
jgi:hypothetical protein